MDAGNMCPPLTPSRHHPAPAAQRRNNADRWGHTTLSPHLRWMSYLVLTSTFLLLTFLFLFADQLPLLLAPFPPPPSSTDTEAPPSSCHSWTPHVCTCSMSNLIYCLWYVPFFCCFFWSYFFVFSISHHNMYIFKYYLMNG